MRNHPKNAWRAFLALMLLAVLPHAVFAQMVPNPMVGGRPMTADDVMRSIAIPQPTGPHVPNPMAEVQAMQHGFAPMPALSPVPIRHGQDKTLYGYAGANPVNNVDPHGTFWASAIGLVTVAIIQIEMIHWLLHPRIEIEPIPMTPPGPYAPPHSCPATPIYSLPSVVYPSVQNYTPIPEERWKLPEEAPEIDRFEME